MGRSVRVRTVVVSVLLAGACRSDDVFYCAADDQCQLNHTQGVCQKTGFCSFPDPSCETAQRYGELAGDGLANACVEPEADTDTDDSDAGTIGGDGIDDGDDGSTPTSTTPADDGPDADGPSTSDDPTLPGVTTNDPSTDDDGATTEVPEPMWLCFGERDDSDVTGVTRDTFIAENMAANNFGAHVDLHLNESGIGVGTLMAFEVTAIPDGSEVVEATLEVWTEAEGILDTGHASVFRLLESWTEGEADFSEGIANWTEREEGTQWTIEGAGPGSHDVTELAQFVPDAPSSSFVMDLPAATVQQWVDDPASNHGLLIQGVDSTSYAWLVSSEHGEQAWRPQLCVGFVAPAG